MTSAPQDQMAQQLGQLEAMVKENSNNLQAVYQLALGYAQTQQPDKALALVDRLLNDPKADNTSLLFAAQICNSLNQLPRVEQALSRIARTQPNSPRSLVRSGRRPGAATKGDAGDRFIAVGFERNGKTAGEGFHNAPNLHSNAMVDSRLITSGNRPPSSN